MNTIKNISKDILNFVAIILILLWQGAGYIAILGWILWTIEWFYPLGEYMRTTFGLGGAAIGGFLAIMTVIGSVKFTYKKLMSTFSN